MLLKTVCTLDVICCRRDTSITEAARLMREHHVGDLVVVDDPEEERIVAGLVTDRDLAVEVIAKGLNPEKTTVAMLLRTPVVVGRDSEDVMEAMQRMQLHGVRRLPVVDALEHVVGVITLDDLLVFNAATAQAIADIVSRGRKREQRTRR